MRNGKNKHRRVSSALNVDGFSKDYSRIFSSRDIFTLMPKQICKICISLDFLGIFFSDRSRTRILLSRYLYLNLESSNAEGSDIELFLNWTLSREVLQYIYKYQDLARYLVQFVYICCCS